MLRYVGRRSARLLEPDDEGANFFVSLTSDARGIEGRNFASWPAHSARSEPDWPRPQALTDAQIEGGSRVAAGILDARASQDLFEEFRHASLPVSVPGPSGNYTLHFRPAADDLSIGKVGTGVGFSGFQKVQARTLTF
jgi:hypothetical protein